MFDSIIFQSNFNRKLLASSHGLAICRFGPARFTALVAISQTQDKLVVFDISDKVRPNLLDEDNVTFISIKDVVSSISAVSVDNSLSARPSKEPSEFLLIGCANSITVYDILAQTSILRISTATKINVISSFQGDQNGGTQIGSGGQIICGGFQRMYAIQLVAPISNASQELLIGEITSEKSTSDSIECLIQGIFLELSLIITGAAERRIRVYQLDPFDNNIQPCELTIDESGRVNCLCGIQTEISIARSSIDLTLPTNEAATSSLLPSIIRNELSKVDSKQTAADEQASEHLSHFAYGLENGSIGVYGLYKSDDSQDAHSTNAQVKTKLRVERLWRHKSKHTPVKMVMFDLNGDGFDELIIGFRSGRLEVRSPLSGQLLGCTRCFKSERLMSLVVLTTEVPASSSLIDELISRDQRSSDQSKTNAKIKTMNVLISCSSSGQIVGFKANKTCKRKPLRCFAGQINQSNPVGSFDSGAVAGMNYSEISAIEVVDEVMGPEDRLKSLNLITIDETDERDDGMLHLSKEDEKSLLVTADENLDGKKSIRPDRCDAKQNVDFLQRLSQLQSERKHLEQRACDVYHNAIQQVTGSAGFMYQSTSDQDMNLAYRWNFNTANDGSTSLELSLLVCCSLELVDFIELLDTDKSLIEGGRLLKSPDENFTFGDVSYYMFSLKIVPKAEKSTKIAIRVCFTSSESRLKTRLTDQHTIARICQRSILVPQFSTLVPRSELWHSQEIEKIRPNFIKVQFRLNDDSIENQEHGAKETRAEVLEWLGENLICFQTGHWISDTERDFPDWAECMRLSEKEIDQGTLLTLVQLLDPSALQCTINAWSSRIDSTQEDDNSSQIGSDFELRLSYHCRKLIDSVDASIIIIACEQGVLRLESNEHTILVDIIKSLVIGHLKLTIATDCVKPSSSHESDASSFSPILNDLEKLTKSAQDLEESERRVQTELYEAADQVETLMQQFYIAQQIDEFSIAKELLGEIGMIFDGAHNSATAYQLNNREKLRLTKDASRLRENITFLLGQ